MWGVRGGWVCITGARAAHFARAELEAASQHVDLRHLDRGELGLKLELGSAVRVRIRVYRVLGF